VAQSVVALRRRPDLTASLETEALFGERLSVLDVTEQWAWVQLIRDRYVGYVARGALSLEILQPTHRVQALGTFLYPAPEIKAPPIMPLPLGAELAVKRADATFAELETGGYVVVRHIAERDRFARDFVDIAERFIGTPYLWGGRTRTGLDCSGLVQIALEATGQSCPRDSDMQESSVGDPVLIPRDLEGLERGEVVFRTGHVGVMGAGVMFLRADAFHMAVAVEPLRAAAERISRLAGGGSRIRTIRRLSATSVVA